MKIRSTLFAAAAAAAVMFVAAPAAHAYTGTWYNDNNPGGYEVLGLGDSSDGTFLHLRGTEYFCDKPGSSYARMRSVLGPRGSRVNWWIDASCNDGNYVRVCVQGRGTACSTYWSDGWQ